MIPALARAPAEAALPDADGAQRRAGAPGASVWVSASAGTGKTKVLTDRVLNLLLQDGASPDRLLCLTFTKAAAAEMANRLAARLSRWTTLSDEDLARELGDLAGATLLPGRDDMLDRARRLFARVLDTPGGLKIQTIHAFCQTVLGRFPLEAGIAPHFRVAEERTAAEMLASARVELLRRARSSGDPALASALGEVTRYVQQADFGRLLGGLVAERGRLRRLLAGRGGLDGLVAQIALRLGLPPDADAGAMLRAACRDAAFAREELLLVCDALSAGSDAERTRATGIRRWIEQPDRRAEAFDAYRDTFLTTGRAIRKSLVTKKTLILCPDAARHLQAEAERLLDLQARCNAAVTLRATAALLRLGASLLDLYEREKRERGLLDYDDLILATRDLLRGGAAWVLYKLDGGIDHILIDEAQDTNPEQWEVVSALAEEFFAGTGASGTRRTLFAVGDDKQSIFSFQRADPAKFEAMRQQFRERSVAAEEPWDDVSLDVSFRSTPAVLGVVDAVFAGAARAGVVRGDVVLRHLARRQGHAGLVELWPLVLPAEAEEPSVWDAPRAYGALLSPDARLASVIAARVAEWLRSGERLESRGRPIRAADVLILVRRRTGFVDEIVKALKARGVPVAGVDRMRLTDQIAVQDLMALGSFLLLPEDDLTLAVLLKSPLVGLGEDELFELAAGRGPRTLWRRLGDFAWERPESRFAEAHALLNDLLARADYLPPYELYADVLGPRGGRRKLVARLGAEANDPVDEFLAQALAYSRTEIPSLQGFLHWIGAGEGEIKRDFEQGERDEVRIMTVHGAKGLEAPIVFLPDTTSMPPAVEGVLWSEDGELPLWTPRKELRDPVGERLRAAAEQRRDEEYRRLLYVALTRAADRLYICGWQSGREAKPDCWYALVAAALPPIAAAVEFDFTELDPVAGWTGPGFRLSERQTVPAVPDGHREHAAGTADELPAWAREPVAESDRVRMLAPSRADDEQALPVASPLGEDMGWRFRRGVLTHRLLQTLPEIAPAGRAAACRRYLDRAAPELDEAMRASIAAECLAILDHPDFAPLFAPGALAEVPVSGTVGGVAITGQIDRLCIVGSEVLIVDYKSNRPPPVRAERVPAAYLRQMASYRALLRSAYGPAFTVRCALLWTETPLLMPLDAALLDRYDPVSTGCA